ncbi:methyltransferase [Nonomuraea sp. B19D2]|uniref:methyltransferase n=1 Tax=Nonomuraea sp. B19D2 TaxID=3159561 RepID=UPI0032DBB8CA
MDHTVDLGCGTGGQARALAARGWTVTAVDYAAPAVAAARRLDPGASVTWRTADVTDPASVDPGGRLGGTVTLVLDNGCLHGIPSRRRPGWAATVETLAAPGADLLVRAAAPRRLGVGPAGIDATDLAALLGARWSPRPAPDPGWYHYRRRA